MSRIFQPKHTPSKQKSNIATNIILNTNLNTKSNTNLNTPTNTESNTLLQTQSNTKLYDVREVKEKMSLFTAFFYLEQTISGATNDSYLVNLMEAQKTEFDKLNKNYIKAAFKELDSTTKQYKQLSVPTITNKNKPDPNILLEALKKIKEVERQLFFVFTLDKDFEKANLDSCKELFELVGTKIEKQYFETDTKKTDEKIKSFYKKSENDKSCAYFTAVYVKIELMRRSFASKFGTNLLLFCRLDLPNDKDLSNDATNKDISNYIKTLIESLYTTTSRRGADGFEGFYGGLVDTIKFNQTAFYEVVNSLKKFVNKDFEVAISHENQYEKLKNLVDEFINIEKAEKLTKQIDTNLEMLVKEIVESVKTKLKDESKAREINTNIEELVKTKIESLKAELKDKQLTAEQIKDKQLTAQQIKDTQLTAEQIDKTIKVAVEQIIESVQDKLKTEVTISEKNLYDKLKNLVDDFINKEKAEKLAEQIDKTIKEAVEKVIEIVQDKLKKEKNWMIMTLKYGII